jgi:hypothetical protein
MTHTPHGRSLQALILDKKGDRSYERVSRDCGGTPTRNALQKLATSPTKAFPDKVTLLGLQRGLPASIDELLSACAVSMGLLDDSRNSSNLVIRGAGELPTSSQQLLISLSTEMQRLAQERDGNGYAAPITHAGESPATDQERHERSTDGLRPVNATTSTRDAESARSRADEDELARRRRERDDAATAEQQEIPLPDEALMAGYDEPQESILAREQQDAEAEAPQD